MFKSLGLPELLIILVILIMVFGLGRLPRATESIGKAIRSFKKAKESDAGNIVIGATKKIISKSTRS